MKSRLGFYFPGLICHLQNRRSLQAACLKKVMILEGLTNHKSIYQKLLL